MSLLLLKMAKLVSMTNSKVLIIHYTTLKNSYIYSREVHGSASGYIYKA